MTVIYVCKQKDANNKPIMIVLAQKACNICFKKKTERVSLFHSEKYCFHESKMEL